LAGKEVERVIEGPLVSRPIFSRHGVFLWLMRSLVRIRYTFFLVSVLAASRRDLTGILIWVGVVLVSVLVHEIGHASAARTFGQNPKIELHAMGGVTTWTSMDTLRWRQRVIVSSSGPAFGFVAGALVWLLAASLPPVGRLGAIAISDLVWVNLGWGVFNLLPILPLDGGQIAEALLERKYTADRARYLARVISSVCGGACAIGALAMQMTVVAIFCALFTWDNLQRMRGLPGVALPR
jgi:stage IV sporulation protein FB